MGPDDPLSRTCECRLALKPTTLDLETVSLVRGSTLQ
jgi:hypothetical protein